MESRNHKSARLHWSYIGGDMWVEIFRRLTPVTIGRCRCVCKEWRSVISSPLCVAAHHSFTAASISANRQPYLLYLNNHLYSRLQYVTETDLRFPFRFPVIGPNFKMVDVINGVVCLSLSLLSSFDTTVLWNPAIRRYVVLPWLLPAPLERRKKKKALEIEIDIEVARTTSDLFKSNAIGFGYQSSMYDFKVVRAWIPRSSSSGAVYKRPRFEVYSSQQGLWREAKAKTKAFAGFKSCGFLSHSSNCCFFNGTIHWLLSTKTGTCNSVVLLMFDCEREDFRTMEVPEELSLAVIEFHKTWDWVTRLFKYSGMLSVFYSRSRRRINPQFEMWGMKEEDSTWKWNKLFSINNIDIVTDFNSKVAMLSEDGYKAWLGWLVLGDPNTSSINKRYRFYQPLNNYVYEGTMTEMTVNKRYRVYQPLNGYAYEETMFLTEETMFLTEDTKGKGKGGGKYYAEGEVIDIQKVLYPQINYA